MNEPAANRDTPVLAPNSKRIPNRATAPVSNDYDRLPYPSMPLAYTQPAQLGALASLFAIAPPPASTARVLEFGCAAGGNIVPLAAFYPNASFLGIDLSQRHVADGQKRIDALGLKNIRLEQRDLTTLDLAGQVFDYIICHGVFSWTPRATQESIFRLCNQILAPNGVVTISYNVLPGWHTRAPIRELCLRYAGKDGTPLQRVARARAALELIAAAADATDPYGMIMQTEARRLKNVPSSYILGEFLAPDNTPCRVQDFIERAARHELEFLCEADLFAAVPPSLTPEIRDRVTRFDGASRAASEQDIDFLTGRLFRRSILVRKGVTRGTPSPDRLDSLHISGKLSLDASQGTDVPAVFRDERGGPITVNTPIVRHAFERLADAYPATLTLEELLPSHNGEPNVDAKEPVRQAIFKLILSGRANIFTLPSCVGRATEPRPKAWAVARAEAATPQPWITNLNHASVPAHPVLRTLLPHLDGINDRVALRAVLADAIRRGVVRPPWAAPDRDAPSEPRLSVLIGEFLEQTLSFIARQALLEPEPMPAA